MQILEYTAPTSSVFSVGVSADTNGLYYIAYCFAENKASQNLEATQVMEMLDGTFVYTGFKPAFVMIKKLSADWNG